MLVPVDIENFHHFIIFASVCIDCIWEERNSIVHGTAPTPMTDLIRRVTNASQIHIADFLNGKVAPQPDSWLPPPPGWCKVNVDAAVRDEFSTCATVGRDGYGTTLFVAVLKVHLVDPLLAEALALKEGVMQALKSEFRFVVLESDCQLLINCLSAAYQPPWSVRSIIDDIQTLDKNFYCLEFTFLLIETITSLLIILLAGLLLLM